MRRSKLRLDADVADVVALVAIAAAIVILAAAGVASIVLAGR